MKFGDLRNGDGVIMGVRSDGEVVMIGKVVLKDVIVEWVEFYVW